MPTAIECTPIDLSDLTAGDLLREVERLTAEQRATSLAYRVRWEDNNQPAQVLLCEHAGRAGIFDGGDSVWVDAEDIAEALAAYNDECGEVE